MAKEAQESQILTEEQKEEVVRRLQDKGLNGPCPMCGQPNWAVADGFFNQALQSNVSGFVIGGPSIPSIGIICTNCGFISHHALGALGLLDDLVGKVEPGEVD